MNRKEIVSLIILILVLAFGFYRYKTVKYTTEKSKFIMDTWVRVTATAKSKNVGKMIDQTFTYMENLEMVLSEYEPEGWLWKVNQSRQSNFPMDQDAFQILQLADSLYRLTGGKFDITIKPVFDLWKFGSGDSLVSDSILTPAITHILPDSLLIKEKLKLVGFDRIRFDQEYLYKPSGMQLTFGALAKGYIVDRAHEYMHSLGVLKGSIDCSSSMVFWGNKLLPNVVGITHPRRLNEVIATLQVRDIAIGTSGDYQQCFDLDSLRYHHILDAHTGYPVKDVFSVTVLNPSAFLADGLSTAVFLMDPEQALEQIKQIPNTNAIIYFRKNNTITSLKSIGIKSMIQSEKIQ